jgi:hypothetical protein
MVVLYVLLYIGICTWLERLRQNNYFHIPIAYDNPVRAFCIIFACFYAFMTGAKFLYLVSFLAVLGLVGYSSFLAYRILHFREKRMSMLKKRTECYAPKLCWTNLELFDQVFLHTTFGKALHRDVQGLLRQFMGSKELAVVPNLLVGTDSGSIYKYGNVSCDLVLTLPQEFIIWGALRHAETKTLLAEGRFFFFDNTVYGRSWAEAPGKLVLTHGDVVELHDTYKVFWVQQPDLESVDNMD